MGRERVGEIFLAIDLHRFRKQGERGRRGQTAIGFISVGGLGQIRHGTVFKASGNGIEVHGASEEGVFVKRRLLFRDHAEKIFEIEQVSGHEKMAHGNKAAIAHQFGNDITAPAQVAGNEVASGQSASGSAVYIGKGKSFFHQHIQNSGRKGASGSSTLNH